ncbi:g569 [Coccomyxa viridis]|uniref:G569 protein n=1 Tax=Coccomyxa viridis TaxID=1274662 RepID=A0ABP1FG07_9CHLO
MFAVAKLVLLVLVAVLAFALSTEGRELLDYYDDCYNGYRGWDWGRGDYYCHGRRWRRDGGWYDGGGWRYGGVGFFIG